MNLADLTLLRPWWLLALLPAGLILWRLGRARGAGMAAWEQVVDSHLAPHVLADAAGRGRKAGLALLGAAFVAAIVALAGPGWGRSEGAYRPDLARVVAVDLSAAMAATDGETSRVERAKLKLLELLRILPPGQTALLVYAGEPYLVAPPSTDTETIARFVPELAAEAVPVAGNRPDLALGMAARLLARSGSREREILWITAGAEAAGLPMAELEGVRLSILHAAPADDPALAALARKGGIYVRMGADDGDLRQLAASPAAGAAFDGSRGGGIADRGYWLLPPLLLLAALAFRRGLLAVLAAPLLLGGFLAPPPALALELPSGHLADYRAWQRLRSGDAEGAAAGFTDRRWRAAASYRAGRFEEAAALLEGERDSDSLYNRGNALARQGKLPEALAVYEESLKLKEDADARHNRDLVESLLKQGGGGQGGGKPPPPPPANSAPVRGSDAEREARRMEEQWLRRVPDEPGSLLRRKLEAEHRRRQAGEGTRPW
jgi:Ca-activated chloride channel family protein